MSVGDPPSPHLSCFWVDSSAVHPPAASGLTMRALIQTEELATVTSNPATVPYPKERQAGGRIPWHARIEADDDPDIRAPRRAAQYGTAPGGLAAARQSVPADARAQRRSGRSDP